MSDTETTPLLSLAQGPLSAQWDDPVGPNAPPPARPKFYCTRCKDPYTVVETPISPLVILSRDPFLLACMSTMSASGPSLDGNPPARDDWKLHDQHARPPGPRVHGLPARIPQASPWRMGTPSYAATVLLACHLVHALTWRYVLSACSGRTVKHVVSIEGSKAVSSRAHRDQPGALYAVCAATAAVTVVAGCIDASDARHAAAACLADVHVRIHE
nr:hypothetical protein HK105_007176 [Polyrhizophydium stewartii]